MSLVSCYQTAAVVNYILNDLQRCELAQELMVLVICLQLRADMWLSSCA
jgi:hypothetical protein